MITKNIKVNIFDQCVNQIIIRSNVAGFSAVQNGSLAVPLPYKHRVTRIFNVYDSGNVFSWIPKQFAELFYPLPRDSAACCLLNLIICAKNDWGIQKAA